MREGQDTQQETNVSQEKRHPMSKLKQVSTIVTELKKISETVTREASTRELENQYVIFGRSIAAQLMSLTPISAIKAQEGIQSILTSYKLQELQDSSRNSPNSTHIAISLPSPTYSYALELMYQCRT